MKTILFLFPNCFLSNFSPRKNTKSESKTNNPHWRPADKSNRFQDWTLVLSLPILVEAIHESPSYPSDILRGRIIGFAPSTEIMRPTWRRGRRRIERMSRCWCRSAASRCCWSGCRRRSGTWHNCCSCWILIGCSEKNPVKYLNSLPFPIGQHQWCTIPLEFVVRSLPL